MRTVYHCAVYYIGNQPHLFILTKRCNTCTKDKSFDEFAYDNAQNDEYAGRCKRCKSERYQNASEVEKDHRKAIRKASEDDRREDIRAHDRERRNNDEARAKRRERNRPKIEARHQQKLIDKLNTPPPPPPTHKLCPACNPPIPKPVSAFGTDNSRNDGLAPYCKECTQNKAHARLDKRREYERQRVLDPEYRTMKRERMNAWRHANAEEIREQNRIKYATDPVYAKRVRTNAMKWIKAHPIEMQAHQMKRLASLKEAMVEDVDYTAILARDGFWCYICEQDILPHQKLEFDHYIPLLPRPGEPKGTHTADNIHPTHKPCNARKSNIPFELLTPFQRRGPDA